jgi:hypothetical protein
VNHTNIHVCKCGVKTPVFPLDLCSDYKCRKRQPPKSACQACKYSLDLQFYCWNCHNRTIVKTRVPTRAEHCENILTVTFQTPKSESELDHGVREISEGAEERCAIGASIAN